MLIVKIMYFNFHIIYVAIEVGILVKAHVQGLGLIPNRS